MVDLFAGCSFRRLTILPIPDEWRKMSEACPPIGHICHTSLRAFFQSLVSSPIDISIYVLYTLVMTYLQIIWRDLTRLLHRERSFSMDLQTYETLRLVAERARCSPEEAASQLFELAAQEQDDQLWVMQRLKVLTARQRQIAAYVCRGDTTRQIAGHLTISETTVKSHIEIVMRKFGVNSRNKLRELLVHLDLTSYL
jgi:DNA-binding CsgD family transcriptional regulator